MNDRSSDGFDVVEATIPEIRAAIVTEETTARAVTQRYLDRIDAYDAELDALVEVNDAALDRADELDERFAESGLVGPLHGVPVVLKDNYDTHDLPTTAGSVALEGSVPPDDAFLVRRLREAGAVVLAKANMQEFAYGIFTVSSLGGQTHNPYALDRLPSGSSGGTAAAIAANLGAVGTGSDTCSSVRSPPAFTNQVGIRPTRGLLSRDGIIPLSASQDTGGPMTRTVADAAVVLDAMAGYDPADPVTARGVGNTPEEGYTAHLDPNGLSGARIGVARQFFGILGDGEDLVDETDAAAVTGVIDAALDDMAAVGATIVDPFTFDEALEYTTEEGAIEYEFKRDLDGYLDGLGDDAPVHSLEEVIETGQYFPEAFRSEEYAADELAGGLDERLTTAQAVDVEALPENAAYLRQLQNRAELEDAILTTMAEYDVDAIAYPTSTVPPVKIGEEQPFGQMNCELSAYSGLPAITVPAGFTDDGLPVGVELLSRPFGEALLLELAYSYEQATMHRRPPAGFGPLTGDTR